MKEKLGEMLRANQLNSMSFIAAEHFVKSLGYEARFSAK